MAAVNFNNTSDHGSMIVDDDGGLTQMHKWFLVTGSLVALSVILGIIYFMITHRNCVGNACSGLRPDPDGERYRRQVLPDIDDLENGQSQSRFSTHLFVNKWMSRSRNGNDDKS